jgi:hypothetical protein
VDGRGTSFRGRRVDTIGDGFGFGFDTVVDGLRPPLLLLLLLEDDPPPVGQLFMVDEQAPKLSSKSWPP